MSAFTELPEGLYDKDAFANFAAHSLCTVENARAMIWLSQLAYENPDSAKFSNVLRLWGLEHIKHETAPVPTEFGASENPRAMNWLRQLALSDVSASRMFSDLLRSWGIERPSASAPVDFGFGRTFGFVAANPSAVIVAFRGTDPVLFSNWVVDFKIERDRNGMHRGFAEATASIWKLLKGDVETALAARPGAKLFFTGHSLGGAMAAIGALTSSIDATAVYTFGMPRAGDERFAAQYNARLGDTTFRFAYGADVVPTVPGAPFRHVGHYLHSRGGVFDTSLLTPDPKLLPPQQWSDDPAFDQRLKAAVSGFLSADAATWRSKFAALRHPQALVAPNPRGDAVGTLIDMLPPLLRDHIPDRYWGALRVAAQ